MTPNDSFVYWLYLFAQGSFVAAYLWISLEYFLWWSSLVRQERRLATPIALKHMLLGTSLVLLVLAFQEAFWVGWRIFSPESFGAIFTAVNNLAGYIPNAIFKTALLAAAASQVWPIWKVRKKRVRDITLGTIVVACWSLLYVVWHISHFVGASNG